MLYIKNCVPELLFCLSETNYKESKWAVLTSCYGQKARFIFSCFTWVTLT
ncbi:hypothetical protein X975_15920, partial [Stegodyphus mimosarum]